MKMKLASFCLAAFLALTTIALLIPIRISTFSSASASPTWRAAARTEETDRTVNKRFQVLADFDSPNRGWKKAPVRRRASFDARAAPACPSWTTSEKRWSPTSRRSTGSAS